MSSVENVTYVHTQNWFAAVWRRALFAFGGLAAIPEMAHILRSSDIG